MRTNSVFKALFASLAFSLPVTQLGCSDLMDPVTTRTRYIGTYPLQFKEGVTEKQIQERLKEKEEVLKKWGVDVKDVIFVMHENQIFHTQDGGNWYYIDYALLPGVKKTPPFEEIFEDLLDKEAKPN